MSKELNELIKELGKIVDGNQSIVDELDKLKSLYEQLKLETAEEFDYPFKEYEQYWLVESGGNITSLRWDFSSYDQPRYDQGHIFKTKQEAERERDKRALLTRFRQFRDKCNGDWKLEFDDFLQYKYTIRCDYGLKELFLFGEDRVYEFSLFGYFKNSDDCKRAIELFGDEIIRLFVEVEK
nr:MAG TPA: hypothetical protein [Caudoviricetes sp.]